MAIEIPERIAFLSRIHLFHDLNEDQFNAVAEGLDERSFRAGEEIIKEGEAGNCSYLIYSGKVRVTRKGREKPLAALVAGDYVGEESVLAKGHRRTATVTAVEDTLTLVLTREHFRQLLKQAPALKANFAVTASSHHMARRIRFKWLQPDEVIYYLARKHPIMLVRAVAAPVLLVLLAAVLMFASFLYSRDWDKRAVDGVWFAGIAVGVIAAGWGFWRGIDWGNDYYIVTDRRVVWLEKVVGIYDSRQEASLSGVQRINVQTDLTGQILDYGSLIVRTIVGSTLTLQNVDRPYQAAALIEEHWKRSKETSHKMQEEEMRKALRERLVPGQSPRPKPIPGIVAKQQGKKKDYHKGQRTLANLFRMRFEKFSIITYRKHVFVLFLQTWKAVVATFFLIGILVLALWVQAPLSFPIIIVWSILFAAGVSWWIYEHVDWSNDIFQVTPDQILDIDKTPLGLVTSDIASLDNILSIEYKRIGILELLFNYGTVYITIGGGKQMAFEDVFNPSAVQEDIERRRLERVVKRDEQRVKEERENIADWFAAYYRHERGFRTEEEKPDETKKEDASDGGETQGMM